MNPPCPVCLRTMLDATLYQKLGLAYSCKKCGLEIRPADGLARLKAYNLYMMAKPAGPWKRMEEVVAEKLGIDKEVSS